MPSSAGVPSSPDGSGGSGTSGVFESHRLLGTPEQIAGQLREQRRRWGISYIGVLEPSMEALGQAIPLVR